MATPNNTLPPFPDDESKLVNSLAVLQLLELFDEISSGAEDVLDVTALLEQLAQAWWGNSPEASRLIHVPTVVEHARQAIFPVQGDSVISANSSVAQSGRPHLGVVIDRDGRAHLDVVRQEPLVVLGSEILPPVVERSVDGDFFTLLSEPLPSVTFPARPEPMIPVPFLSPSFRTDLHPDLPRSGALGELATLRIAREEPPFSPLTPAPGPPELEIDAEEWRYWIDWDALERDFGLPEAEQRAHDVAGAAERLRDALFRASHALPLPVKDPDLDPGVP